MVFFAPRYSMLLVLKEKCKNVCMSVYVCVRAHERTMPMISADYCFPRAAEDSKPVTALVLKVRPYGVLRAFPVDRKGDSPLVVSRIAKFVRDIGLYKCMYIRSRDLTGDGHAECVQTSRTWCQT